MKKVIIMGAAGRDFHNFNTYFRDNPNFQVVAFTATQIPGHRRPEVPGRAGREALPRRHPHLRRGGARRPDPQARRDQGLSPTATSPTNTSCTRPPRSRPPARRSSSSARVDTMIKSKRPVVSVCAVRTGCGKSQTSRKVALILKKKGRSVAAIRHPMPYGDLVKQKVQRFATYEDMAKNECTIEEREEYEPHVNNGIVVYAGVDYEAILREAEKEADVILWDGGNNDFPFYKSDLDIVVVDPHRPGHELLYYPGETNFRRADVIIVNKMDTAPQGGDRQGPGQHQEDQPRGRRHQGQFARRSSRTASRSGASACWSSRTARP